MHAHRSRTSPLRHVHLPSLTPSFSLHLSPPSSLSPPSFLLPVLSPYLVLFTVPPCGDAASVGVCAAANAVCCCGGACVVVAVIAVVEMYSGGDGGEGKDGGVNGGDGWDSVGNSIFGHQAFPSPTKRGAAVPAASVVLLPVKSH